MNAETRKQHGRLPNKNLALLKMKGVKTFKKAMRAL